MRSFLSCLQVACEAGATPQQMYYWLATKTDLQLKNCRNLYERILIRAGRPGDTTSLVVPNTVLDPKYLEGDLDEFNASEDDSDASNDVARRQQILNAIVTPREETPYMHVTYHLNSQTLKSNAAKSPLFRTLKGYFPEYSGILSYNYRIAVELYNRAVDQSDPNARLEKLRDLDVVPQIQQPLNVHSSPDSSALTPYEKVVDVYGTWVLFQHPQWWTYDAIISFDEFTRSFDGVGHFFNDQSLIRTEYDRYLNPAKKPWSNVDFCASFLYKADRQEIKEEAQESGHTCSICSTQYASQATFNALYKAWTERRVILTPEQIVQATRADLMTAVREHQLLMTTINEFRENVKDYATKSPCSQPEVCKAFWEYYRDNLGVIPTVVELSQLLRVEPGLIEASVVSLTEAAKKLANRVDIPFEYGDIPFSYGDIINSTSCVHMFHSKCWSEYNKSKIEETEADVRALKTTQLIHKPVLLQRYAPVIRPFDSSQTIKCPDCNVPYNVEGSYSAKYDTLDIQGNRLVFNAQPPWRGKYGLKQGGLVWVYNPFDAGSMHAGAFGVIEKLWSPKEIVHDAFVPTYVSLVGTRRYYELCLGRHEMFVSTFRPETLKMILAVVDRARARGMNIQVVRTPTQAIDPYNRSNQDVAQLSSFWYADALYANEYREQFQDRQGEEPDQIQWLYQHVVVERFTNNLASDYVFAAQQYSRRIDNDVDALRKYPRNKLPIQKYQQLLSLYKNNLRPEQLRTLPRQVHDDMAAAQEMPLADVIAYSLSLIPPEEYRGNARVLTRLGHCFDAAVVVASLEHPEVKLPTRRETNLAFPADDYEHYHTDYMRGVLRNLAVLYCSQDQGSLMASTFLNLETTNDLTFIQSDPLGNIAWLPYEKYCPSKAKTQAVVEYTDYIQQLQHHLDTSLVANLSDVGASIVAHYKMDLGRVRADFLYQRFVLPNSGAQTKFPMPVRVTHTTALFATNVLTHAYKCGGAGFMQSAQFTERQTREQNLMLNNPRTPSMTYHYVQPQIFASSIQPNYDAVWFGNDSYDDHTMYTQTINLTRERYFRHVMLQLQRANPPKPDNTLLNQVMAEAFAYFSWVPKSDYKAQHDPEAAGEFTQHSLIVRAMACGIQLETKACERINAVFADFLSIPSGLLFSQEAINDIVRVAYEIQTHPELMRNPELKLRAFEERKQAYLQTFQEGPPALRVSRQVVIGALAERFKNMLIHACDLVEKLPGIQPRHLTAFVAGDLETLWNITT